MTKKVKTGEAPKALSSRQKKIRKKAQEKAEKLKKRREILQSLADKALAPSELKHYQSSRHIGQGKGGKAAKALREQQNVPDEKPKVEESSTIVPVKPTITFVKKNRRTRKRVKQDDSEEESS
mmetsp:Transcript_13933/g.35598  ORF Transcript_13933/g.35598 Transcript_13933/m.35598 type:complete len:123 (-) Transcript_13933:244-612(-)|eukprot:CAMPEP_0177643988 /NCGR_PEP_ID=MMETSP0447-20121125/8441_1 /TAXON_ID=0 /ORGANISM="Stygamoeba regulata, Strain BSH-02190019" /LENGTH=122 /DNA_ID=CAMNT_0019146305 /DNA_START=97 /DNA_END=465 /DNA_ORIENTATION=+